VLILVELYVLCISWNGGMFVHVTVAYISAEGGRLPRGGVKTAAGGSVAIVRAKAMGSGTALSVRRSRSYLFAPA